MRGKLAAVVTVITLGWMGVACCPHSAPPPAVGPPPTPILGAWPGNETCFENTLLWSEVAAQDAFNSVITLVSDPPRAQDIADFNKAKKAVDDANAAYINVVNAVVAGQQGNLAGAMQQATAALTDLINLVDTIIAPPVTPAPGVSARAAIAAPPSATDNINSAKSDLAHLKGMHP